MKRKGIKSAFLIISFSLLLGIILAGCSSGAALASEPDASLTSPAPGTSAEEAVTTPSPVVTSRPTTRPTTQPTSRPSPLPTAVPTPVPTTRPAAAPTVVPTKSPSSAKVIDGVTYYNGYADPRTITPGMAEDPSSLTALVNKYWALEADFVPPLVSVEGTNTKLHPAANEAWILLREACREATGISLELLCGYRSYSTQAFQFRDAIERKGIAMTVPYNALEGRSEHQLGLAIDVTDGLSNNYTLSFSKRDAYAWLHDHAHEFGYILRYQTGKEKITGYHFEPWHYRFVGIEAATACYEQGWALEEYTANIG